ncbi:MAG: DUF1559 domain-containing protein [Gemmatales bacterium]
MYRCLSLASLLVIVTLSIMAQDKPTGPRKWTHEEARKQYERSPGDGYLQYVTLQTARREKIDPNQLWFLNRGMPNRREGIDLFNTFSGALAIQESLQLDTMLGGTRPGRGTPDTLGGEQPKATLDPNEKVKVSTLQGPTIQSHPWEKMLAGRKPELGTLARCVPDDFYFIEFTSAAKLKDALATTDLWTGHLFAQMLGSAQSQQVELRLKQQLGIQGVPPELLDTLGLESIGITGSDLYLADGSDVTLLVQGKTLNTLRQWMDRTHAHKPGTERSNGKYLEYEYTYAKSAKLNLNVYAADPRPDLHVRSTSLPAFKKVLAAIAGKDEEGKAAKRLGETAEYAFIRTILPRGAAEEDGLVYLSDPFIRRLLGPQVKLAQHHRLIAHNHLRMIERAALMYRTENGKAPKSLEDLAKAECAPGTFGQDQWACPAGGKYTLSDDGMSARNSLFGTASQLTPLIEMPLEEVTRADADSYKQFLQEYNQYWRTFFDPIAVRVKITPEQFRLETVVLPLIDNSIYTGLAEAVGGPTTPLASLPVPPRVIHSVSAHINKAPVLKMLPNDAGTVQSSSVNTESNLRQLMIAVHNYHNDYNRLPHRAVYSKDGKPLLSWRVMLLPYLEQDQLYKQFKLDEPWDSDHNKKLIARIPPIYQTGDANLGKEYRTRLLALIGKNAVFSTEKANITLGNITVANGTSNTLALVEAASDKAVVWTKPDDLEIDLKNPAQGLTNPNQTEFLAAACDASIFRIRANADPRNLATVMQWRGTTDPASIASVGQSVTDSAPLGRSLFGDIPYLNLPLFRQFLEKGIGDQIGYHVFDASQPINADVTNFIGTPSPLGFMGPGMFGSEAIFLGMLAQSLSNPVCITIPVKDATTVDRFLADVDQKLAELPRNIERFIRTDKYQIKLGDRQVRVFAIKVLGISFRVAWARMGNWLVLTNHPVMLEELFSFYSTATVPAEQPGKLTADTGHAQFRIRPQGWQAVLPGYRLGWAENHRSACELNQQQITNIARAYPELLNAGGEVTPLLLERVQQIYGTVPFCPDGGSYTVTKSGTCECSVHGQAHFNPRQLLAPSPESHTMKSLEQFKGFAATLTFMEDGLHAVVVIDRK